MRVLNWPGPEIDKRKTPEYEWAYIKAYLEGESNTRTESTYEQMFGVEPTKGTPFWLVRMAIYYGALSIGFSRAKRKLSGTDSAMLACVSRLNENELRNNVVLNHHMWLHDVENAEFGGRELVA